MNSDSFMRLVAKNANFTFLDTQRFFDALGKSINECVKNKEGFTILNFGTLDFGKVAKRISSKLFGGIELPETKTMFFRLSVNLKKLFKESNKPTPADLQLKDMIDKNGGADV